MKFRNLPFIETAFVAIVAAGLLIANARTNAQPAAPAPAKAPAPVTYETFVAIAYPGGPHGRFNEQSEAVAVEIVELAHRLRFTGVGHWQPEGGADLAALQLAAPYTKLADSFMRPTSLRCEVSPNFELAWKRGKALGLRQMWYEGAASVINLGTAEAPVIRWYSPDDAPLVAERVSTICARYEPDYLFIDDINKLGAYLGMPSGVTWSDPPDTDDHRVRRGDPPVKRHRNTVASFHRAVLDGVAESGAETAVGYEPRTQGFWTDDQLGRPAWMQIVELADLDAFPDATRPGCWLVLNSLEARYTLADIRRWIAGAHEKGYHAIVTWWVLKVALQREGFAVPTPPLSERTPASVNQDRGRASLVAEHTRRRSA